MFFNFHPSQYAQYHQKKMTFCGSDIYILETLTNDSYMLSSCNLDGRHILP